MVKKTNAGEMAGRVRMVAKALNALSLEAGVLASQVASGGTSRAELDALEDLVVLRARITGAAQIALRAGAELGAMDAGEARAES